MRVYVAEKEVQVDKIWPGRVQSFDELWSFGGFGELEDHELDVWSGPWHKVDMFWTSQMLRSPLRVWDADEADIVFVPLLAAPAPPAGLLELERRFMQDAAFTLRLLGQKPHVIVLSHALTVYLDRPLLTHPNSKNFTFLTSVARDYTSKYEGTYENILAIPHFGHVHWSPASQSRHASMTAAQLSTPKTSLISQSFAVRRIEHLPQAAHPVQHAAREQLYMQCQAESNVTCQHMWIQGGGDPPGHTLVAVAQLYQTSWFVTQTWGDFLTRVALVDAMAMGSVPVVPSPQVEQYLPFRDMLPWGAILEVVEDAQVLGPGCQCKQAAPEQPSLVPGQEYVCHCSQGASTLPQVVAQRYAGEQGSAALLRKAARTWAVRHVMQYSQLPVHTLARWTQRAEREPEDDAFTFSLKALMRMLCDSGDMAASRCAGKAAPPPPVVSDEGDVIRGQQQEGHSRRAMLERQQQQQEEGVLQQVQEEPGPLDVQQEGYGQHRSSKGMRETAGSDTDVQAGRSW